MRRRIPFTGYLMKTSLGRAKARPFSAKPYIGIDYGTSNIRVAIVEAETVKVIGKLPSVLWHIQGECELAFGSVANRGKVIDPENAFFGTKCLLGRNYNDPVVQKKILKLPFKVVEGRKGNPWAETTSGEPNSACEIWAFILYKMKTDAESVLGKPISKAVFTVPTWFDDNQIQSAIVPGRLVGLLQQQGINEPIAAAIAYGLINKEEVFAVVDLGGGTFDVSILEVSNRVFQFKGPTKTDIFLGGEDFDNVIVEYLVNEFKRAEGVNLAEEKSALAKLRKAAEEAKIQLSYTSQTEIIIPFIIPAGDKSEPKHLDVTLTRSKFESLIEDLVERTRTLCKSCLKEAGMTAKDINEVLVVGGMGRVPILQKIATEIFRKSPSTGVKLDEAVVVGAAAAIHVGFCAEDMSS